MASAFHSGIAIPEGVSHLSRVFPRPPKASLHRLILTFFLLGRLAAQTLSFTDAFPTDTPPILNPGTVRLSQWNLATSQPDEPAHDGRPAFRSMWARFTALDTGLVRFTIPIDTIPAPRIAVYTNDTLATLGHLASRSLGGFENEFRFEVTAGTTYSVALDWIDRTPTVPTVAFSRFYVRATPDRPLQLGETVTLEVISTDPTLQLGAVRLLVQNARATTTFNTVANPVLEQEPRRITLTNLNGGYWRIAARQDLRESTAAFVIFRPPADDIADAAELPSRLLGLDVLRNMPVGSIEPDEHLPLTNQWFGIPTTIWWKWTPTYDGPLSIASSPHGVWAAYDGDPRASLPIQAKFNGLSFDAVAGHTYYFQMIVANSPIFDTNRIRFRRLVPILDLEVADATPDASIGSGTTPGRAFLAPSQTVTVTGTNLHPDEAYTGFALTGGRSRTVLGQTTAGLPIHAVELDPEGSELTLLGTNLAGVVLSSQPIFVASRPTNDIVQSPAPWPLTEATRANGRLGTPGPDDPSVPGVPSVRSRWWKYEAAAESTVVFKADASGTKPVQSLLAVFRGQPGRDSQPIAVTRTNALTWSVQAGVAAGDVLFIMMESDSDLLLQPPVIHPFRWRDPVGVAFESLPFNVQLSPALDPAVTLRNISFPGTVGGDRFQLPGQFILTPSQLGVVTIVFTYRLPSGQVNTLEHRVQVLRAGDHFSDARLLPPGAGGLLVNLQLLFGGTTREPGEPDLFGFAQGTLWRQWRPARSGTWQIEATNLPSGIAVLQGDQLENLQILATHSAGTPPARIEVDDQTTYHLLFASPDNASGTGNFRLRWVPHNDAFSSAQALVPPDDFPLFDPLGATAETGEPAHGGQPASRSLWWTHQSAESGYTELVLRFHGSTATPPRMALYRGDSLASLVPVEMQATRDEFGNVTLAWNHQAGETLRLAVDAETTFQLTGLQTHSLRWGTFPTRPRINHPSPISVVDLNPGSGPLEVVFGAEFGIHTYEQTNDPLSRTWIPRGDSGTLRIEVAYRRGEEPWRQIRTYIRVAPTNDDFTDAEHLPWDPEAVSRIQAWRAEATLEPEEPAANYLATGSSWWRWIAPFTGDFELTKPSPDHPAVVLFTGNTLSQLTFIGALPHEVAPVSHSFSATAGQTFHLAIGSSTPGSLSEAVITYRPTNDAFAARTVLPQAGGRFPGNVRGSNLEPGEPQPPLPGMTGSVWFEYTASQETYLSLSTQPLRACTLHRGDALGNLQPWSGDTALHTWPYQVPVRAGETLLIRVLHDPASLESQGQFVLNVVPGSSRHAGTPDHASRRELPDRTPQLGLVIPYRFFPEPFETGDLSLPSNLHPVWWSYTAPRAGRLRVRAWPTNETGEWHRIAANWPDALRLDALQQRPDGSIIRRAKADQQGRLVVDLDAGETVTLRLAAPLDLFQVNLMAELGAVVGPSTLSILRTDSDLEYEIETIPGDPWHLDYAESIGGPWNPLLSGTADATRTRGVFPGSTNTFLFYRVRSR